MKNRLDESLLSKLVNLVAKAKGKKINPRRIARKIKQDPEFDKKWQEFERQAKDIKKDAKKRRKEDPLFAELESILGDILDR